MTSGTHDPAPSPPDEAPHPQTTPDDEAPPHNPPNDASTPHNPPHDASPLPNPSDPADAPDEPDPPSNASLLHRGGDRLRRIGRWLRVHAKHALVVAVVGALIPVAADQIPELFEAPPPACPGPGCDGQSPKNHGCAADVATWEPTEGEGNIARIQLRYSRKCDAVWGRILNGEPGDVVSISVVGGSSRSASIDINHDKYTDMATVGETFRVRLCAEPGGVRGHTGTWVKYCFVATERSAWN
ncbi:DUF2690 domain-containing protein [Streptomyces halobius]|uniref:DUF2690 domain-containing protein n=1 Tax=Streptomyces halobius TaxID=2879846 RepID=A0ABY4MAT2_9ACTN|nr:DUF2690 domain-containing protein [Streptomyces halobius]UQA94800.1 DUF2690 domain-containing protein [Streptomyces halobius]